MPLNDLASIVDRIGIVAATPADQDEPVDGDKLKYMAGRIDQERSIADCARQIEHAYPILRDWPTGFERLIASVAGRNPVPDTAHKVRRLFATRMGQLLLDPVRGIDGKPIGLLDAALREWLRQEHGYRWGQRVDQPKIPKWKSARKFTTAPTTTSSDTMLPTKIQHRILKLQTNDTFMQASKLNALIAELWTTPGPLIVAAEADIRSRQEVKIYGRRTFPKNLYSVRDALAVMERRHGPSPLTRPRHDRGTGDLI